ncbi:MAG: HAMP domain-containing sensor histidine kinase [Pseudomonadota bacterium]|jgi:signal transduction histidine kinase|nr:MAG: two-component sensor histidine kinase [Pseudomonadota bacterium]
MNIDILPPRRWNATIRTRLTVLYAAAFFIAGAFLIGILYVQMHQALGSQLVVRSVVVGGPAADTDMEEQRAPGPGRDAAAGEAAAGPALPPRMRLTLPEPDLVADAQRQIVAARAEAMRRVMLVSVVALAATGVLAALLGWLLAGQALQPLRQITATVRGIADRNLHQRIAMSGPRDEIKDLADTLDGMLERLDRAFDSQQRFIANASHELRTPLAINRTLIEVAMLKDGRPDSRLMHIGSTLLEVNQRHERIIDGLLMLAGSEQEIADPRDVDLAQVARHVLSESEPMARDCGVKLRLRLDPAPGRGDAVLLERLLHNLVDNALRYNAAEGGWVELTTGRDEQGRAMLRVENPGPVIPDYEVPRLFEPFRRLSSTERLAETPGTLSRRGAGLGLSIVQAIVTSHRGGIQARARTDGGLAITVWLPVPG